MPSALSIVGAAVVAALGGFAVASWDRHPAVDLVLPIPILRPHLRMPPSLLQRAQDAEAAATRAKDDLKICDAAISAQSEADLSLVQRGQAALAGSEADLRETRGVLEKTQTAAAGLRGRHPDPGPDCPAWQTEWNAVQAAALQAAGGSQ